METRTSIPGGPSFPHIARRSGGQRQGKCLGPKCTIVYCNAQTLCHLVNLRTPVEFV